MVRVDVYTSEVVNIGINALDFLGEKMIILFGEDAPLDLAKFSILIKYSNLLLPLEKDDFVIIGDSKYTITSIGEEVNVNLSELGHVVLKFDASIEPMLPGNIHVSPTDLPNVVSGTQIIFKKRWLT